MAIAEELQVVIRAEVDKALRDLNRFEQGVGKTEDKMQKLGQAMTQAGGKLSKFVTLPLAAAAGGFVALADKQAQAEASLENAIAATGRTAEINVEVLGDLASELQSMTTFGDEAQLSALALTQQLANLDQQGLQEVLPGMLNFSEAMGVDLQSAAALVGKTLGSSTNALSRYGIEIDTTLDPTEKLAQLTEQLEEKFGGAAAAAAEAGLGPLKQLQNSAGDLAESFGELLLPSLNSAIDAVQDVVDWMQGLDEGTKKVILVIGGLAAATGPIMMAVGALLKLKAMIIAINTTALFGPVGIIVGLAAVATGLAVIGKRNRDARLEELAEQFAEVESTAGMATEQIEQIQHAMQLGSMHGFADAAENVKMIAVELGVSQQAVIDIGLESENVTDEYKEQLRVLKDQFAEQMAISAAMEDQWLVDAREQAAADARAQAMLDARAREEERLAEARAAIQERANEAYTAIERRLEEINRLEEFNLSIGEEYDAEAQKRAAILEEVNKLISDGTRLNTSFAGALEYIRDLYGDILEAQEEITDGSGDGDGGGGAGAGGPAPVDQGMLSAYEAMTQALIDLEEERQAAMRETAEAAERYRQAEVQAMVDAHEAMGAAMAEYEDESAIERDVGAGVDSADWINIGQTIADSLGAMLSGEDSGFIMTLYDGLLDAAEGFLNMYAPGLGTLARTLRDIWNEHVLFPILEWAADLFGIDYEAPDEDSAEEARRRRIEELNDLLDEELQIRNDAMRELDDRFRLEFDVLRDQWERNLVDTEDFVREMEGLSEEYDAEEERINEEVQRIREILERLEDPIGWMRDNWDLTNVGGGGGGWSPIKGSDSGSEFISSASTTRSGDNITVNVNGPVNGDNWEEMLYGGIERAKKRGRIVA